MKILVPCFKHGPRACGPTALSMVFAYFGKQIQPQEIIKGVGGLTKSGVRTVKLAAFAKRRGFKTACYSYNRKKARGKAEIKKPEKADIVNFLKKRLPVILAVRTCALYDTQPSNKGHFIVITGYEKNKFWYNDPSDGKQHSIKEDDLMFAWFNNVLGSSAYLLALQPKR